MYLCSRGEWGGMLIMSASVGDINITIWKHHPMLLFIRFSYGLRQSNQYLQQISHLEDITDLKTSQPLFTFIDIDCKVPDHGNTYEFLMFRLNFKTYYSPV